MPDLFKEVMICVLIIAVLVVVDDNNAIDVADEPIMVDTVPAIEAVSGGGSSADADYSVWDYAINGYSIPTFHQFYGDTNLDDGSVVIGKVNGAVFEAVVSGGKYGYDPLFLVLGGVDGEEVEIYGNGWMMPNQIFEDGAVTRLDIVIHDG